MAGIPSTEQTTFASWITVCKMCGGEITMYRMDGDGVTRIWPCGHEANMVVKRNPLLPDDAAA